MMTNEAIGRGAPRGCVDTVCCHCRREQARAYYASHHEGRTRHRARNLGHEPRRDGHEPEGRYRELVELAERRTERYRRLMGGDGSA